jgi:hypothetical protein
VHSTRQVTTISVRSGDSSGGWIAPLAGLVTARDEHGRVVAERSSQMIEQMLRDADTLRSACRRALSRAALAVALVSPGNCRPAAYDMDDKGELRRNGCSRVQHRIVRRMIDHLGQREVQNFILVPTHLWIEPEHRVPLNNAIHPNDLGHEATWGLLLRLAAALAAPMPMP